MAVIELMITVLLTGTMPKVASPVGVNCSRVLVGSAINLPAAFSSGVMSVAPATLISNSLSVPRSGTKSRPGPTEKRSLSVTLPLFGGI